MVWYSPSWSNLLATAIGGSILLVRLLPEHVGTSTFKTFCTLFAVATFVKLTYTVIIWPKLLSPIRHLPAPKGGSFFNGHFGAILKEPTGMPMREWINSIPNDGLLRYNFFANSERVLLTGTKAIGEVLVTKNYDFVKPRLATASLGKLLGFGVLLAEGEEHKTQRKNLMPAFSYRHVKELVPTFWTSSAKLVKLVTAEVESKKAETKESGEKGAVIDFGQWLNRATLDIIGIAGMGFSFNALDDPNTEISVTYREIFQPSQQAKILGLLTAFIPYWILENLPLKRNMDVSNAANKIRAQSRMLIENKQRVMAEKGGNKDKDILAVALESGGFTVENLVDQTMTFLAAGHETTATATTWAMVALSQRPEMQSRLREEIRDQLPSVDEANEAPITAEMLDRLPYLHAVCQEVLRFHSPVPFTRREALVDTIICGQVIPKGTTIAIVSYAINFSKELWGDDADEFKPERWLGQGKANNGGASNAYANMTFLHGPRSCIGQAFAKHEFQALLAAIIGRFEVELEPKDRKIELESGIVTRPKGPLKLRMTPLEGW